jgi:hypothetical protein
MKHIMVLRVSCDCLYHTKLASSYILNIPKNKKQFTIVFSSNTVVISMFSNSATSVSAKNVCEIHVTNNRLLRLRSLRNEASPLISTVIAAHGS